MLDLCRSYQYNLLYELTLHAEGCASQGAEKTFVCLPKPLSAPVIWGLLRPQTPAYVLSSFLDSFAYVADIFCKKKGETMVKKIILIVMVFVLMLGASAVFADNEGGKSFCYEDQFGCWVTDEDGQQIYIMFWSEEARAFFMGGFSKPGELVVEKPNTGNGRLTLDSPKTPSLTGTACFIYCANLDWGNNPVYAQCVKEICGVSVPPNVPSSWKK